MTREPDITDTWETKITPGELIPGYRGPTFLKKIGAKMVALTHNNVDMYEFHPKFGMNYIAVRGTDLGDSVHLHLEGDELVASLWEYMEENWYYKHRGYQPSEGEALGFVEYQQRRIDPNYDQFLNPVVFDRDEEGS